MAKIKLNYALKLKKIVSEETLKTMLKNEAKKIFQDKSEFVLESYEEI